MRKRPGRNPRPFLFGPYEWPIGQRYSSRWSQNNCRLKTPTQKTYPRPLCRPHTVRRPCRWGERLWIRLYRRRRGTVERRRISQTAAVETDGRGIAPGPRSQGPMIRQRTRDVNSPIRRLPRRRPVRGCAVKGRTSLRAKAFGKTAVRSAPASSKRYSVCLIPGAARALRHSPLHPGCGYSQPGGELAPTDRSPHAPP